LEDSIQTLRDWVNAAPNNPDATQSLATALISAKRYDEAVEPLKAAMKDTSDDSLLGAHLLTALLRSGRMDESESVLVKLRQQTLDAPTEREIAYALANANIEMAFAQEIAEKAVSTVEQQMGSASLSPVAYESLRRALAGC
jgi:predicted Zn-dependent protease